MFLNPNISKQRGNQQRLEAIHRQCLMMVHAHWTYQSTQLWFLVPEDPQGSPMSPPPSQITEMAAAGGSGMQELAWRMNCELARGLIIL